LRDLRPFCLLHLHALEQPLPLLLEAGQPLVAT